jgi:hypothetical protein
MPTLPHATVSQISRRGLGGRPRILDKSCGGDGGLNLSDGMSQTFIFFFRFTPAVPTSFSYPELAHIRRCGIGGRPQKLCPTVLQYKWGKRRFDSSR